MAVPKMRRETPVERSGLEEGLVRECQMPALSAVGGVGTKEDDDDVWWGTDCVDDLEAASSRLGRDRLDCGSEEPLPLPDVLERSSEDIGMVRIGERRTRQKVKSEGTEARRGEPSRARRDT